MKKIGDHTWQVTEPTPIEVGMPATPPSVDALAALRDAVASSGATAVYWFWVSINGDVPHLGLAVAPAENAVVSSIGQAVESVWRRYSPDNPVFDILRLGQPDLDLAVKKHGWLLYEDVKR